LSWRLVRLKQPLIGFVYLGSSVCLQLPPDSSSRWTPLLLANGRRSPAPVRDSHPIDDAHAGRTGQKKPQLRFFCCFPYKCSYVRVATCDQKFYIVGAKLQLARTCGLRQAVKTRAATEANSSFPRTYPLIARHIDGGLPYAGSQRAYVCPRTQTPSRFKDAKSPYKFFVRTYRVFRVRLGFAPLCFVTIPPSVKASAMIDSIPEVERFFAAL